MSVVKDLSPHALDSRWLRTLVVVADEGRVSSAARRLNLSQPAVTAQVQKLEDATGQSLFRRLPRGVELTDAGKVMLDYALRIEALLVEAERALAPDRRMLGPLEIAASTTVAETVVPDLLETFAAAHPDVTLSVRVGNTDDVTEQVRSGAVPLGLVEGQKRAAHVRLRPFLDDAIVPCSSDRAPVAWRSVTRVEDLAAMPLALRERGSGTRAVVTRALTAQLGHRRAPHSKDVVLGSNALVLAAVSRGLAIGFLSRRFLRQHPNAGLVVLDALAFSIPRSFSFALPQGEVAPVAEAFMQHALRLDFGENDGIR